MEGGVSKNNKSEVLSMKKKNEAASNLYNQMLQ
jgi:hypothetical protein